MCRGKVVALPEYVLRELRWQQPSQPIVRNPKVRIRYGVLFQQPQSLRHHGARSSQLLHHKVSPVHLMAQHAPFGQKCEDFVDR